MTKRRSRCSTLAWTQPTPASGGRETGGQTLTRRFCSPLTSADPLPKRQCTQFRSSPRPGCILLPQSGTTAQVVRLHLNGTPERVAPMISRDKLQLPIHPLAREIPAWGRKRRRLPSPSSSTSPRPTMDNHNHHTNHPHVGTDPRHSLTDHSDDSDDSTSQPLDTDSSSTTSTTSYTTHNEPDSSDPQPPVPPIPPALPPAMIPFTGDFRGCTWNSQAFFAHGWRRHNHKLRHAKTLVATQNFVGLQETHSVEGWVRMLRFPMHSAAFYSHGTARMAGVRKPVDLTDVPQAVQPIDSAVMDRGRARPRCYSAPWQPWVP